MIAALTGRVKYIFDKSIVVDVNGIGFDVIVSDKERETLATDTPITLLIATQVSEQDVTLYGFATVADRSVFYQLTSVSGVGSKTAFNLISKLGASTIQNAIIGNDEAILTSVAGIGSKNAKRIILELRGKYTAHGATNLKNNDHPDRETLIEALQKLGYKKNEIIGKLAKVDASLTTEAKIKKLIQLI